MECRLLVPTGGTAAAGHNVGRRVDRIGKSAVIILNELILAFLRWRLRFFHFVLKQYPYRRRIRILVLPRFISPKKCDQEKKCDKDTTTDKEKNSTHCFSIN